MRENKTIIQNRIVANLEVPSNGILNLAPRLGKTRIAINILKKENPESILWVTSNVKLRDEDIPEEFKKWKALKLLKKTKIICYQSLNKEIGEYEKIILDEYQNISPNNMANILNSKLKYKSILCLSGGHPKSFEKNSILQRLNLKILSSITIEEAVEKKVLPNFTIYTIGCNLDDKDRYIKAGNKKVSFLQTEKRQYEYLTNRINKKLETNSVKDFDFLHRMHLIYNSPTKYKVAKKLIDSLNGRKLVFCSNTSWADRLSPHSYHYKTTNEFLNKFIKNEIEVLTCVNSGGTGYTFTNVDNLIIVQVDSNKRKDITQKLSRALLLQKNFTPNVYILYLKDTVDETWKNLVLSEFKKERIVDATEEYGI